jgi:acyl-CoA thioester hydrolase
MPLTHTRTFRVRHYECDGYGHVNNATYLRYMQEAAFDASAAAGYGLERYRAMGRLWFIHETWIEYLRPLTYGDSVAVKTWVADFGRVRSRRMYEFSNAASGELAAQAYTDWAFIDMATGRPAAIPPELVAAFFPEGAPPAAGKREPFPTPPAPPAGVFKTRRRVEWRDVDAAGHVNNANYVAYIGEAAFGAAAAFGWDHVRMTEAGFGVLARRHHVEYRREAVYGDELEISTWLSDFRAASVTRHYSLTRTSDGELVARVNSQYVWVDRRTLKPIRIPAAVLVDLTPNTAAPTARDQAMVAK